MQGKAWHRTMSNPWGGGRQSAPFQAGKPWDESHHTDILAVCRFADLCSTQLPLAGVRQMLAGQGCAISTGRFSKCPPLCLTLGLAGTHLGRNTCLGLDPLSFPFFFFFVCLCIYTLMYLCSIRTEVKRVHQVLNWINKTIWNIISLVHGVFVLQLQGRDFKI